MNQNTKQRIVGTIVLLALALIFLPIVFDGDGSYQPEIASRIPEPPQIPVLGEPLPTRPVIIDDEETAAPTVEPDAPDGDAAEPVDVEVAQDDVAEPAQAEVVASEPAFSREMPELDASGLPGGWSVRLGSFSDRANADNLVVRLQEAGYRAYTRQLDTSQGTLTGVYVGPWIERARVDEYLRALQEEFRLSGIVVAYEMEQL